MQMLCSVFQISLAIFIVTNIVKHLHGTPGSETLSVVVVGSGVVVVLVGRSSVLGFFDFLELLDPLESRTQTVFLLLKIKPS